MSDDSKTGRRRPPSTQFRRGQKRAGGRPKGAIGEKAIVQKIAGERHRIQQSGRDVELNTIELLLLSMRNLAMSGHLQAAKWLGEYRERQLPQDKNVGFLLVPEAMPDEQYIAQQMFLNRFRTNPELKEDPLIAAMKEH
ncbi:DUF5681 domain-containing protein [Bradyrhizobium sp. YCK136]|uniref:DUF5681 domain-containing protein n=1 Tax=Bradyrhizobium TaxID=374 RepID=UPI001B8B933D|nr:DUF5681 domain-containing protein [Bradyrhizobium diazoefficiens]MBR0868011.1 hypothetical protein [Bradyrhizobium diazoefficiens]MBR0892520.1 hypothetical protein [Bradyrhizobium diazoefficiens]MBR0924255.1 hypothetical protein [Bradyrhizobium diazoefficiens]